MIVKLHSEFEDCITFHSKKNKTKNKQTNKQKTGKKAFSILHEFNRKMVNLAQKINGFFFMHLFDQSNGPIRKSY